MKKKYLVVTLVTILILTIGVSFAYIRGIIVAKNKSNISLKVKELYILFKDETEISEKNIDFGWEETKSFSVENQGDTTFYYNIIIEDLINTLESDGLQYKINSSNGYDMKEFEVLPKQSEKGNIVLVENIPINGEKTQEYTITFKYVEDPVLDQSGDMGKKFSGKLGITEGEKPIPTLVEKILEDNVLKGTRTNFDSVLPTGADDGSYNESKDAESGLYVENNTLFTEDTNNDGQGEEVYYFAGNVTNNWVKFANLYWRIIRSNEDGSLRLLYAGTSTTATDAYATSGKSFNSNSTDPMYVGLKYGTSGTLKSNRTNDNPSTILGSEDDETTLYGWYKSKIYDGSDGTNSYDDYVSKTAIYCNDRAVGHGTYDTGSTTFVYAAYTRLNTNKRPSFKCGVNASGNVIEGTQNVADKFSGSNESAKLIYPVGLMTADEIVFAGGKYGTNNSSAYYYRNANGGSSTGTYRWWTASPSDKYIIHAEVSYVYGSRYSGRLNASSVDDSCAVRPVVSLKSCVLVSDGNGSSGSPYTFSIDSTCASAVN